MQFVCPNHLAKGIQSKTWSHFKISAKGCSYCVGRGQTTIDIQQKLKSRNIKVLSEYKNCETPIECLCEECGHTWTAKPRALTSNGSGCPICSLKKRARSRMKSTEQFQKELSQVNPNIKIIGQYVGSHRKVKCQCLIDGNIFDSYPSNLLNLSCGCPKCNISLGEQELLKTLDILNVPYKTQYSIEGCKLIKPLKFDAFDVEHNIAFEYNGEQHYKVVDFSSKDLEKAKEMFKQTQKRDKAKYRFCKDNNIPIIIVPYWKRNNMKQYLETELQKLDVFRN